ncbi:hypothetical protein BDN72DRAFT_965142 [Pluteus cervinus]|uniref:Uncharacterized protein n=1 Tax=Pluteus cervinus TaxID=181527 RepID=A0ACD3A7A6_9AGAR|nr:hypothetical protein BDN72DRAFT_965142 [Pluteus cervinus]
MELSDQAAVHINTPYSVINNTINNVSSSSTSKRARRTKRRSAKDARVRVLLTQYAVHASFDAAERGNPPKCHPDTRIAVQDSLIAWRSNPAAGPVRLISGWAGTGKTTIAQTMAEYWAREGQLAGSFFFSRSSNERSKTGLAPATILHQFLEIFGADVDVGHLSIFGITWPRLVDVLVSISSSLPQSLVIVIDGLDECSNAIDQISLLSDILRSLGRLGSSIKVLISCRPERHLENLFNNFAPQLGSSYHIHLGQSEKDKNDIRIFLRVSFDRICQDRRKDGAMSLKDGLWPSQKEIEELVDRASGQFIFAATVVRFVDDENEDPVEMLNLVMEQRTSSFEAIDQLYLVILEQVGMTLDTSEKSLERRQLMQNLILHVNYEPSSSLLVTDFWFAKEVTINILVKHLQALLVCNPTTHDQDSENLIHFRHKSFHNFLARPSTPHSFSLSEMNPVSKFFFSLRTQTRKAAYRPGGWVLQPSQWLGYTFFCCGDHPPTIFSYEEEARRLHRAYVQDRPTFRGCICIPQLDAAMLDIHALRTFKSCGQDDCVIDLGLLTLCSVIAIPVNYFTREWDRREHLRTISFRILISLLWLRVMLYSLLYDPSTAFYGTVQALISRSSCLNWQARCLAVINALLCMMVPVNTRWELSLLLYLSHTIVTFLLNQRFDTLRMDRRDSSVI